MLLPTTMIPMQLTDLSKMKSKFGLESKLSREGGVTKHELTSGCLEGATSDLRCQGFFVRTSAKLKEPRWIALA